VKKNLWRRTIAGAVLMAALPSAAAAEVGRIELDVAGYLCGL
jgi:hypothetical protein